MTIFKHIDFQPPGFSELASPPQYMPGYQSLVMSFNPEAYWRLNESPGSTLAVDECDRHHAMYAGNVAFNQPGAITHDTDNAAGFDGQDARMSISSLDQFAANMHLGVSFVCWIKTEPGQAEPMYVTGKRNNNDGTALLFGINMTTYGQYQRGALRTIIADQNWKLLVAGVNTDTGITDGQWHMLALAADPANNIINLYVDDTCQPVTYFTRQSPSQFSTFDSPMIVAAADDRNIRRHFKGALDEPALFNLMLENQQIQTLYQTASDT